MEYDLLERMVGSEKDECDSACAMLIVHRALSFFAMRTAPELTERQARAFALCALFSSLPLTHHVGDCFYEVCPNCPEYLRVMLRDMIALARYHRREPTEDLATALDWDRWMETM